MANKSRFRKKQGYSRKTRIQANLKKVKDKFRQLEKREFWTIHLTWPKFLRRPKIRFNSYKFKFSLPVPNRMGMFILAIVLIGFSLAGGAYNLVNNSVTFVADPQPTWFYPKEVNEQFVLEGLIGFLLIFVGFLGFFFVHQSSKHFYHPRYSYMLFAVGITLISFAFYSLTRIMQLGKMIEMYQDLYPPYN